MCSKSKRSSTITQKVKVLVVSNSLHPHGLQHSRLLCPWISPGKNSGVGTHSFLQGIFPVQGLKPFRKVLYGLSHQRSHINWNFLLTILPDYWNYSKEINGKLSLPEIQSESYGKIVPCLQTKSLCRFNWHKLLN